MPTSAVGSIIRAATRRPDGPLNILTFSCHEAYQSNLDSLPHHFYLYEGRNTKTWNDKFRKLPSNHTRIGSQLPMNVDLDLVWSQEKNGQYPIARQISRELQLPLIAMEHTLPAPGVTESYLKTLKEKQPVDVQLFISDYSRQIWGWEEDEAVIIHHGIDTDTFHPGEDRSRERVLFSAVNDWINRDIFCGFKFWQEATKGLPVRVLGDTPGLSKPAEGVQDLAGAYRSSQIFVNTSTVSPIPTALLEAMSSGCAVVSTATCMIPEIIADGVNGILCDTPAEMRSVLVDLLDDPRRCERLGASARQTVLNVFSKEAFASNWDRLFRDVVDTFTPGVEK